MTVNNNYCCKGMQLWVQDRDCPLSYMSEIRYYTMSAPESMVKKNEVWPGYIVLYCPNCGTKFPNNLVEERMNILEKEYGIDNPYNPKQKKLIPQEFFTDEWWKKRGL